MTTIYDTTMKRLRHRLMLLVWEGALTPTEARHANLVKVTQPRSRRKPYKVKRAAVHVIG